MNQNSLHIEFEKLTDLIVGAVSESEKAEINAHLLNCPTCALVKSRAENVIGVMRSDRLEEVPSHILERSFDLLREKRVVNQAKPSFVRHILAVLESETSSLIPTFGLRSGQPENIKRLWLTADDAEIDLRIHKSGDKWDLSGQVYGGFVGGIVVLSSAEDEFEAEMTDLCEFFFVAVPPGKYKLSFLFTDTEIEIPEISVGD